MEALGGLPAYQRMSSIGQGKDRGGGSERVLTSWLKELGLADRQGKDKLKYVLMQLSPSNQLILTEGLVYIIDCLRSVH